MARPLIVALNGITYGVGAIIATGADIHDAGCFAQEVQQHQGVVDQLGSRRGHQPWPGLDHPREFSESRIHD